MGSDTDAPRVSILEHENEHVPSEGTQHRFYLKDGNLKFELDDGTLYNVHRYFFDAYAPNFAAEALGGETSEAVKLHDISSIDFERFLSMIYPTELGVCDIQTVDEWTSVLRLAARWSISSLRDLAIRNIEPIASPIDKIVIAREFNLGRGWLLPAFAAICDAPKWLEYVEAERLGLRTVVEIGRIREAQRLRMVSPSSESIEAAVLAATDLLPPHTDTTPFKCDTIPLPTALSVPLPALSAHEPPPTEDSDSEPPPPTEDSDSEEQSPDPEPSPESPLDRALLALKLASCDIEGESMKSLHRREAEVGHICQELAREEDLILDILALDTAVQRIETRLAMLIGKQLFQRRTCATPKKNLVLVVTCVRFLKINLWSITSLVDALKKKGLKARIPDNSDLHTLHVEVPATCSELDQE